jgi:hypothetical protein
MDATNELQNGNKVDEETQSGKVLDNVSQPRTVLTLEETEPAGVNQIINYRDVLTHGKNGHGDIKENESIKATTPDGNNFPAQVTVGSSQQGVQDLSTELEPGIEKVSHHGLWYNI